MHSTAEPGPVGGCCRLGPTEGVDGSGVAETCDGERGALDPATAGSSTAAMTSGVGDGEGWVSGTLEGLRDREPDMLGAESAA